MYDYKEEKEKLFTIEGMETLVKVKSKVGRLLEISGAFKLGNVFSDIYGDSFLIIACIDFMVEQKMIKEIKYEEYVIGQNRTFIKY